MRIAQVAPLYESVPPRFYGGTERVVSYLTEELVALGHDVTLFASAESVTSARLVPARRAAIRLDDHPLKSDVSAHFAMLHDVRARAAEFDVLHFHIDPLPLPFFGDSADRTVTTLHGRLDIEDLPEVYRRWPNHPLVSISDAQRTPLAFAHWVATVHHGLPPDLLEYMPGRGGYLAFLGRISPEKRVDRAIRIAERAGLPLRIAAKVDDADAVYFAQEIKPLLDAAGHVEFVGEVNDRGKNELLGNAAALLFPIDWPEPFGLVMIEAMACGTPVIAWDCGSVAEIVSPAETGFVVRSEEEAVDAVAKVTTLDRRHVRDVFERRFSAATMAAGYVDVYERLLAQS